MKRFLIFDFRFLICLALLVTAAAAQAQALPLSISNRVAELRARYATNLVVITTNRPPAVTNITIGWRYLGPTNTDVVIYGAPELRGPWNIEAILPAERTNFTFRVLGQEHFWLVSGYDPNGVGLMNPEPGRVLE